MIQLREGVSFYSLAGAVDNFCGRGHHAGLVICMVPEEMLARLQSSHGSCCRVTREPTSCPQLPALLQEVSGERLGLDLQTYRCRLPR